MLRTLTDSTDIQHADMRVLAKQRRFSRAESAGSRPEEPYLFTSMDQGFCVFKGYRPSGTRSFFSRKKASRPNRQALGMGPGR